MVTRRRHSAASKLLLLFHHASRHCQGLSVFVQLWMNIYICFFKKAWIWLGNFYLGGPAAGRNGQPSSDLVPVHCLVRKKTSLASLIDERGGWGWSERSVCEANAVISCVPGAGRARGRWLGWLGWRAAGECACCDPLKQRFLGESVMLAQVSCRKWCLTRCLLLDCVTH